MSNVLPFLIRSFCFPLRVQFPEWSVQPLVAVPWGEPISVYSHIAIQFPADSDVYFYDGVDMCGLLKVLFPTLRFVCLTAYNTSVMAPFCSAAGAHGEVILSHITR